MHDLLVMRVYLRTSAGLGGTILFTSSSHRFLYHDRRSEVDLFYLLYWQKIIMDSDNLKNNFTISNASVNNITVEFFAVAVRIWASYRNPS